MFRNARTFALCWTIIALVIVSPLPFAHYVLGWR